VVNFTLAVLLDAISINNQNAVASDYQSVCEWCRCMEFVVRQNAGQIAMRSVDMQNVNMMSTFLRKFHGK